ncbi:unnamed protein product [Larinioides sclopetarius]|uniref:SKP1 component POZ domain-containing protein n=1 Tax=Larinioides sclopetarius TaxID=280406 RepID=A0AAV1YRC9_9ARAC
MPKEMSRANDNTMNVDQKDAAEVPIADGKSSNDDREVPMVEFVSAEGESFFVEEKVASKFKFPDKIQENLLESGKPRFVTEVDSEILSIMIKWAEKHVDDPETNSEDEAEDKDDNEEVKKIGIIDEWDKELLSSNLEILFRLANVGRIVQVKGFMNVLLRQLASLFKGKSRDEMRKMLNLPPIKERKVGKHEEEN